MIDLGHCQGCRNDFYNGQNDLGVTQCWSRKEAKLVKRQKVHISQCPPWRNPIKLYPNCYHATQHVMVDPSKERR